MSFRFVRRQITAAALGACVALFGCLVPSPARGAFTNVNPARSPEKSVDEILTHIYGGTFTRNGLNYSNGQTTATRLQDVLDIGNRGGSGGGEGNPTNLFRYADDSSDLPTRVVGESDDTSDQLWTAPSVSTSVQARYASYSQEFGWVSGEDGGTYHKLFKVDGTGFDVDGDKGMTGMAGQVWRWARTGDNGLFTSKNSDNSDGVDHMVTYRITQRVGVNGSNNATRYLLFWEDLKPGQHPDYDYNDLVVELVTTTNSIPEPGSVAAVLGAVMLSLRRRR